MIVASLVEPADETRSAITPNVISHYHKMGYELVCQTGIGAHAGFSDEDYQQAEIRLLDDPNAILKQANILVLVQAPKPSIVKKLSPETLIVCPIDNDKDDELLQTCCHQNIALFSMNHIPRISRAQTMDSLSSQANLAGYRAVLEAVYHFNRMVPMMMTAAGMIQPAKVLVLGAGVAGLQAIATAKRLGSVVYAFDVRSAAKEQVQSLGAEFIEVASTENLEAASGYAKESSEEYQLMQAKLIDKYATLADIIICTALIPHKKAPILLHETSIQNMKKGSIIVDLATARGGNCAISKHDKIIEQYGVQIIGFSNLAARIPKTASELYAMNIINVLRTLEQKDNALSFNPKDEIMQQALLCYQGKQYPFKETT